MAKKSNRSDNFESKSGNQEFGMRVIVPRCISETTGCPPNDTSGPNCSCSRKCGCVGAPNSNGTSGDTAGDQSYPQVGGGVAYTDQRTLPSVGGEYKPVNVGDGAVDVGGYSIGSAGPVAILRYSNQRTVSGALSTIEEGLGTNFSMNLGGRIHDTGSGKMLAFFAPTCNGEKYWFQKETDGSFTPLYGILATLIETSTEYWLMIDGAKTIFDKTSGTLQKIVSAGGIETDFIYDSNDLLEEVVRKRTVGSTHIFNSLIFDYQSASTGGGGGPGGGGGMLSTYNSVQYITERSYVGTNSTPASGDYTLQSRMELVIADTLSTDRYVNGNLRKILMQVPDGMGGWTTEATHMFVYYTDDTSTTYPGLLKYVIDPSGYESLANPDTATETQLKEASSKYFQYNGDIFVTRIETRGGGEYATVAYTENTSTPTDPANHWLHKAVYTSNDGSTKTVYTSHLGADMLVDESDGTNQWIHYTKFDSDGRADRYHQLVFDHRKRGGRRKTRKS